MRQRSAAIAILVMGFIDSILLDVVELTTDKVLRFSKATNLAGRISRISLISLKVFPLIPLNGGD